MSQIIQLNGHGLYAPALNTRTLVLDLGANLGRFSSEITDRFGCSVVMVEANPDLCRELERTGATVHNVAVAGTDGIVSLNISVNLEGSSVLPLPEQSIYGATLDRTIEVKAMSLASLLESVAPRHVDVLKIDIEGAEVEALNSVSDEDLLKIPQITVEFHDDPSFQFNLRGAVSATIDRLRKLGFAYLQFNRPHRTNALFLGPALDLSVTELGWLRIRYDYIPALLHSKTAFSFQTLFSKRRRR